MPVAHADAVAVTAAVAFAVRFGSGARMTDRFIQAAAQAAHEANRAFCRAIGDQSQPSWDDAPAWQRTSAVNGVVGVLDGNGPEQSHESWLKEKEADGWVYGTSKDPVAKTHPCMVPYDQLPPEQKVKDAIFVAVVTAVLDAASKVTA